MRRRFHGLKKIKLRQSWNKYNLYNLSRSEPIATLNLTYFQQKWAAKAATRAYHAETVREKKWQNMFRPCFNAVVPMNYEELATDDGEIHSMGRGSGFELAPDKTPKPIPRIPYANMIYTPAERRLDTAIFRALFASSTRQARQFVTHGYVKVNGKKMIYPGYLLNPGDMFQVEPDRVLHATGAPKDANERRASRRFKAQNPGSSQSDEPSKNDSNSELETPDSEASSNNSDVSEVSETSTSRDPKKTLNSLLTQAKTLLSNPPNGLHAKRKRDLRAFVRLLKQNISQRTILTESIEAQFLELISKLEVPPPTQPENKETDPPKANIPTKQEVLQSAIADADRALLREALEEARDNPIDLSKPYATPWRPRDYMSPFAFIPRYLEVHHRICSAVYLRHPVARPGSAEIPTPFGHETNSLTHLWYLRRR